MSTHAHRWGDIMLSQAINTSTMKFEAALAYPNSGWRLRTAIASKASGKAKIKVII